MADGEVIRRDVVLRTVDQALGEVRRPVFIVPRVDVQLAPASGLWPAVPAKSHEFVVTLRHYGNDTTSGTVTLEVPSGWQAPVARPYTLRGSSDEVTLRFQVRPPANAATRIGSAPRDRTGRRGARVRLGDRAGGLSAHPAPAAGPRLEREGPGRRHQAPSRGCDRLRARRRGPDSRVARVAGREGHPDRRRQPGGHRRSRASAPSSSGRAPGRRSPRFRSTTNACWRGCATAER